MGTSSLERKKERTRLMCEGFQRFYGGKRPGRPVNPCVNVDDCREDIATQCAVLGWKWCKETKQCYKAAK